MGLLTPMNGSIPLYLTGIAVEAGKVIGCVLLLFGSYNFLTQVDYHIISFTLNWVIQGMDHVVPDVYGVIVLKKDCSYILFIKYIQDMNNEEVINRSKSRCEYSYIDTLSLNKFINIIMFA